MLPDRATRRDALGLSAGLLLSLAGCAWSGAETDREDSPTAGERSYAHTVDTPESITVRNPEGDPAVRSPAHSPEEDLFESSAAWDYEDWLVTSPKDRELLDFSQGTTGVETAQEFMAETDLSRSTLLVHQYNIGPCETRGLTRLKWGTEFSCGDADCAGIHLNYDETMRDRDEDCRETGSEENNGPPYPAEFHDSEATIIRLPAEIQSYGRFSTQV